MLVPFIHESFKKEDFSKEAGFVGIYYHDIDKPAGGKQLFLVYDDSVRTEESMDTARRINNQENVKRKYIRYVEGKPLMVYSYWVNPLLEDLFFKNSVSFSVKQKLKILQFWGTSDEEILDAILVPSYVYHTPETKWMPENTIPSEDYRAELVDFRYSVV